MFFSPGEDDDGSGFSVGMPTSGSKLSSLFGMDQATFESGNESLKYTAPRPPKAKEGESKTSKTDAPSLLFACACHAFKYLNDGQFVSQGKLGVAILGHLPTKDYKVLLYLSQKKPVTNARIHTNFQFNVQKNNYASFYDDQSQSWSLCFDSEPQLIEFSKWVCLAKFNVQGNIMITQELNVSEGQAIEKGDTVEMQYTGWLHAGNAFGKIFDSNKDSGKLFKFKVGKGKVIKGWDTGVVGMKKGSKRFLIIPPDLAYEGKSIGDRVPANSTLIFEVEVTRVKFANPQTEPDGAPTLTNETKGANSEDISESLVDETSETLNTNDNLKERTKSINDQLSKTPESTKSKLLERMSKMGQSIIKTQPVPQRTVSQEAEVHQQSETSEPIPVARQQSNESQQSSFKPESPKPHLKPKPEPVPRPAPAASQSYNPHQNQSAIPFSPQASFPHYYDPNSMFHPTPPTQQLALYQSPQAMQAQMLVGMAGLHQQSTPQPSSSGITTNDLNLMMTDGRLKHSEIKTDLTRLLDKIDNIAQKLNSLEDANKRVQTYQPQQQPQLFNQPAEMEASVLMQNIVRIIKENEKFRTECEEKTQKIEKLNERMTDLLTKNQQYFERSNELLASQSDSMQNNAAQAMAKVSALEQMNIKLESDLSSTKTQLLHATSKEEANVKRELELLATVENLKVEIRQFKEAADSANTTSSEHEAIVEELKSKLRNEKKEQKQLKMKLEQLEEEHSESKVEHQSLSKTVADMKKKRKEDKSKHDEEMEELRNQHEEELQSLKKRYKKETGSESEKLLKLEEELNEKHQKHLTSALKSSEDKHNEEIQSLNERNATLTQEIETLNERLTKVSDDLAREHEQKMADKLDEVYRLHEAQLHESKNEVIKINEQLTLAQNTATEVSKNDQSFQDQQRKIDDLNASIETLKTDKLQLQEELKVTKHKRESDISKLDDQTNEIQKLKSELDEAYDKGIQEGRVNVKTISAASYKQGYDEGKASTVESGAESKQGLSKEKLNEEVKKVMNGVFHKVKEEFEADSTYEGRSVVQTMLNTIKEVTIKMMKNDDEDEDSDTDSEEEDDDDDEDTEDEEEEEKSEITGRDEVDETETGEEKSQLVKYEDTKDAEADDNKDSQITMEKSSAEDVTSQSESFVEPPSEDKTLSNVSVPSELDPTTHSEPIPHDVDDDSSKNVTSLTEPIPQENTMSLEESTRPTVNTTDTQDGVSPTMEEDENLSDDEFVTDEGSDEDAKKHEDVLPDVKKHEDVLPDVKKHKDVLSTEGNPNTSKTVDSANVLEQVGLDSSIFGASVEPTASIDNKDVTPEVQSKPTPLDESTLFFPATTPAAVTESSDAKRESPKKTPAPSLFDDEDDDELFKPKTKAKSSAFNRSPPPLFGDDDDDTNWI